MASEMQWLPGQDNYRLEQFYNHRPIIPYLTVSIYLKIVTISKMYMKINDTCTLLPLLMERLPDFA